MTLHLQVEFAVQFSGENASDAIQSVLQDVGTVDINAKMGRVIVETENVPWNEIQQRIEGTGRRAVLTGFGGKSCVSIVSSDKVNETKGVIRFCAVSDASNSGCVIDGAVDGLTPNSKLEINVHEYGDVSSGCESVGNIFEQSSYTDKEVSSDANGALSFRLLDQHLNVSDLIGRSVVISNADSKERLACGIIARSAGIFENYKKICACDGVTLWEERDKTLAGKGKI
ncbi:Copper chaperone for superoxide dismutase [Pseudolycoriella hygida]|uniref:superoxide dismutase n=1 Tax=Pseudolycoriella hygida TaxID=35572 RepID=A0A9Q0MNL0_9DIPT|nr:Copper chaperone for superoxide dismutase [Pseudolycoriella hygida]